jgi:ferric-dicitrate binding protein FerR (iron transport regulator)
MNPDQPEPSRPERDEERKAADRRSSAWPGLADEAVPLRDADRERTGQGAKPRRSNTRPRPRRAALGLITGCLALALAGVLAVAIGPGGDRGQSPSTASNLQRQSKPPPANGIRSAPSHPSEKAAHARRRAAIRAHRRAARRRQEHRHHRGKPPTAPREGATSPEAVPPPPAPTETSEAAAPAQAPRFSSRQVGKEFGL